MIKASKGWVVAVLLLANHARNTLLCPSCVPETARVPLEQTTGLLEADDVKEDKNCAV